MSRYLKAMPLLAGFVGLILALAIWIVPARSDHGPHHGGGWHWADVYFQNAFTVEKAEALGYERVSPCVPQMGYHYVKPEEAEAWFAGRAGGLQVLLYDRTGFLVGVEYLFTAPGADAPPSLGLAGPTVPAEEEPEGMPTHYSQHIYFIEPSC